MIHAYDKTYLANAQKNLARMLDYLTNSLHVSLENAWQWFLTSKILLLSLCITRTPAIFPQGAIVND